MANLHDSGAVVIALHGAIAWYPIGDLAVLDHQLTLLCDRALSHNRIANTEPCHNAVAYNIFYVLSAFRHVFVILGVKLGPLLLFRFLLGLVSIQI
jgi:hypothetical protein